MKKVLLLVVWLAMYWSVAAQNRTISGTVTDKTDGQPIPGASVLVKGTSLGTQTDMSGKFTISVGSGVVLIFKSVGYLDREITVGSQTTINITMEQDRQQLGEVVVVAYGEQSKRKVIGAISEVKSDQIATQQITSISQALQGVAAGVQVNNTIGQPGESPTIRIRGVGSYNASASPLYVLDGVPYDGNIANLNPDDIESMNVLKDATSAALYGSRAANGVVLITTKSGKKGGVPEISFSTTIGSSRRAIKDYEYLNSYQQYELGWEALRNFAADNGVANPEAYSSLNLANRFRYNPFVVPQPVDQTGKLVSGASLAWNTDWEKELSNSDAMRQDYSLSVSGGSEKTKYFISGGYLKQDGYLITSNYNRYNGRLNLTSELRDWVEVGLKSSIAISKQNYPTQDGTAYANVVQYIRSMSSLYPVYQHGDDGQLILDDKGQPIYDFGKPDPTRRFNDSRNTLQPSNLLATTNLDEIKRDRQLTNINAYAQIKFLKDFRFKTTFGWDRNVLSSLDYQNPDFGDAEGVLGRVTEAEDETTYWTWNNMVSYDKTFGDHQINAMASTEAYKYNFSTFTAAKTGYPFPGLPVLTSGATLESIDGYTIPTTIVSYLGRASYSYKNRYNIEGTVRWDGSSRFAPDRRWGFFPSIGASWLISDESFMSGIKTISYLKLRTSYGVLGNNALTSYFPYQTLLSTAYPDLDYPGIYLTDLGNPNVTWEKQGSFNIGLDFGILDERLTGSVEYFNKSTYDLLFKHPLVPSGGVPSFDENVGDVRNSGVEISLGSRNFVKKNFTWNTDFNITFLTNKITKLAQEQILDGAYKLEVGRPFFDFFIPTYAGVDPEDGNPMWYQDELDANGNPTGNQVTTKSYSAATRYYQGSAIPKVTGGLNNTFTYKAFDFSFLFNYSFGGKILDQDYSSLMHGFASAFGDQMHVDELKRWQKPGDVTDVPRLDPLNTDNVQRSTRFLFSGDYIRLRNVTLGYRFVPKSTNIIKSLRVFVQADNYWTWYKGKRGLDPEQTIGGNTNNRSSAYKTISGGINLTF